jgi:hypothetical protein
MNLELLLVHYDISFEADVVSHGIGKQWTECSRRLGSAFSGHLDIQELRPGMSYDHC